MLGTKTKRKQTILQTPLPSGTCIINERYCSYGGWGEQLLSYDMITEVLF